MAQAVDAAAGVGTQVLDGTGCVVHANAAFCRMVGWTREELVGFRPPYACWPEEDIPNLQQLLLLARNGRFPPQGVRIALKRRSGERFPALWLVAPLGNGNEPGGLVASVVDLSGVPGPDEASVRVDAERRLDALLNHGSAAVFEASLDGRILFANKRMCELVGYSRDELLARNVRDLAHPGEVVEHDAMIQALLDGRPGNAIERRCLRKDGTQIWISGTNALIHDDRGRPARISSVLFDITSLKAAEVDLRHGLEQLHLATEGAGVGLWYWTLPGEKLEWSDRCRAIFELPAGSEPGFTHLFQVMHPEDRERVRALIDAAVARKAEFVAEYRVVHADGTIHWISAHGRVYTHPDGSLRGMGGMVIDVTEKKRVADELERMRLLMAEGERIAGLGAWEYVVGTQETIWSEGECHIYGVDPLQKSPDYQRMLQERIHPEDAPELDRVFGEALQQRKPYSLDHRIVRPDGTVRVVRDLAQAHFDAAGDLVSYVGVTMDITERKRAEAAEIDAKRKLEMANAELSQHRDELEQAVQQRTRELADALEVAQSADRAKTTFLATVSHELRTPLNAVIGFSTLLLDGSIAEPLAEQRKPLSVIRQSGQHLLDLVQEILDLSSIEAGNLTIVPVPVNMRAILEESRDSMLLKATERELELRPVACEPGLLVLADRMRLGQVVRNLLSNAIKFTDHGFVQVRASSVGGSVRVEIVDTGVGIPANQQSYLFQPFYRITGGQARLRPGTGLGLAISRRIVEALGGTIGFESEEGRGSCFWFTLPAAGEP